MRQALREMQEYQLVVINDARTSRIPWETIHIDGWFPAAAAGMSRKYEAEDLPVAKWLEERRLDRELARKSGTCSPRTGRTTSSTAAQTLLSSNDNSDREARYCQLRARSPALSVEIAFVVTSKQRLRW